MHRDTLTQRSFEHKASFCTHSKLTQQAFTQDFLCREDSTQSKFFTKQAFAQRSSCTEKLLHKASFCTQEANTASFYTMFFLHREDFTQSKLFHRASFCTEKFLHREIFTHHKASCYTENFLHREALTHSKLLHREVFAQSKLLHFYTQQFFTQELLHKASFLHREAFTHSKFLHREVFTQSKFLHREAFTHSKFLHKKLLHKASFCTETQQVFTQRSCYTGCATIEKCLLPKHHSQLSCSQYITIYDSQLQNTIVFRTQPQQRGTLTQPFHCDLQRLSCKTHKNYAQRLFTQIATPKPDPDAQAEKATILKHFSKEIFTGKSSAPK